MTLSWTTTQHARLTELAADDQDLDLRFSDAQARNQRFQTLERQLVKSRREQLDRYREEKRIPSLLRLQQNLSERLVRHGYVQVATPTMMARGHLRKMGIDATHPLNDQIFWVDANKCLRPMLAPHLYYLLKDMLRLWEHPVRLFEIGSCFRKESKGRHHTSEFTMLNLAEMGSDEAQCESGLRHMIDEVMSAAGIDDDQLETTSSEVYGTTIDVLRGSDGLELGSAAMGPHPLDDAWNINEAWFGVGFGLERLLMATGKQGSLGRLGRSLFYLDGICLKI